MQCKEEEMGVEAWRPVLDTRMEGFTGSTGGVVLYVSEKVFIRWSSNFMREMMAHSAGGANKQMI